MTNVETMNCTECGKTLDVEKDNIVVKIHSAMLGVIYEGDGCCNDCSDNLHERAFRDYSDDVRRRCDEPTLRHIRLYPCRFKFEKAPNSNPNPITLRHRAVCRAD